MRINLKHKKEQKKNCVKHLIILFFLNFYFKQNIFPKNKKKEKTTFINKIQMIVFDVLLIHQFL